MNQKRKRAGEKERKNQTNKQKHTHTFINNLSKEEKKFDDFWKASHLDIIRSNFSSLLYLTIPSLMLAIMFESHAQRQYFKRNS